MKRGFTVMEIMVCIAIVMLLAAIISPLLSDAKRNAKATSSQIRLRQFHLVLKQYQSDYDGDGVYGSMASMGLPTWKMMSLNVLNLDIDFMKSPCAPHPSKHPTDVWYSYFPGDDRKHWLSEIELFKENMCLVDDMQCSHPSVLIENIYQTKLGLGVLLSGQLVARSRTGDYNQPAWWADPVP